MINTLALTTLLLAAPVTQDAPAPAPADTALPAAHSGLTVVPARLDLGTVVRGTSIHSSVWLVNASLEPVSVTRAKAGCGCTTVDFTPVTIAPGAAERVWFDIKAPGKVKSKSVKLDFHPEWGQPVTLTTTIATSDDASAEAPPAGGTDAATGVLLVPVTSDLGAVASGATIETGAWLINAGASVAHVSAFKTGCGCTTAVGFAATDLAPGAAKLVRLRVTPKAKAGSGPVKTVSLEAVVDAVERPVHAALTMSVGEQVAGGVAE